MSICTQISVHFHALQVEIARLIRGGAMILTRGG
jgi:hypothetical protein